MANDDKNILESTGEFFTEDVPGFFSDVGEGISNVAPGIAQALGGFATGFASGYTGQDFIGPYLESIRENNKVNKAFQDSRAVWSARLGDADSRTTFESMLGVPASEGVDIVANWSPNDQNAFNTEFTRRMLAQGSLRATWPGIYEDAVAAGVPMDNYNLNEVPDEAKQKQIMSATVRTNNKNDEDKEKREKEEIHIREQINNLHEMYLNNPAAGGDIVRQRLITILNQLEERVRDNPGAASWAASHIQHINTVIAGIDNGEKQYNETKTRKQALQPGGAAKLLSETIEDGQGNVVTSNGTRLEDSGIPEALKAKDSILLKLQKMPIGSIPNNNPHLLHLWAFANNAGKDIEGKASPITWDINYFRNGGKTELGWEGKPALYDTLMNLTEEGLADLNLKYEKHRSYTHFTKGNGVLDRINERFQGQNALWAGFTDESLEYDAETGRHFIRQAEVERFVNSLSNEQALQLHEESKTGAWPELGKHPEHTMRLLQNRISKTVTQEAFKTGSVKGVENIARDQAAQDLNKLFSGQAVPLSVGYALRSRWIGSETSLGTNIFQQSRDKSEMGKRARQRTAEYLLSSDVMAPGFEERGDQNVAAWFSSLTQEQQAQWVERGSFVATDREVAEGLYEFAAGGSYEDDKKILSSLEKEVTDLGAYIERLKASGIPLEQYSSLVTVHRDLSNDLNLLNERDIHNQDIKSWMHQLTGLLVDDKGEMPSEDDIISNLQSLGTALEIDDLSQLTNLAGDAKRLVDEDRSLQERADVLLSLFKLPQEIRDMAKDESVAVRTSHRVRITEGLKAILSQATAKAVFPTIERESGAPATGEWLEEAIKERFGTEVQLEKGWLKATNLPYDEAVQIILLTMMRNYPPTN